MTLNARYVLNIFEYIWCSNYSIYRLISFDLHLLFLIRRNLTFLIWLFINLVVDLFNQFFPSCFLIEFWC